jgi:hypothetical protein
MSLRGVCGSVCCIVLGIHNVLCWSYTLVVLVIHKGGVGSPDSLPTPTQIPGGVKIEIFQVHQISTRFIQTPQREEIILLNPQAVYPLQSAC